MDLKGVKDFMNHVVYINSFTPPPYKRNWGSEAK
jgi:hypothetical protein